MDSPRVQSQRPSAGTSPASARTEPKMRLVNRDYPMHSDQFVSWRVISVHAATSKGFVRDLDTAVVRT